jgi:hypothetical protein
LSYIVIRAFKGYQANRLGARYDDRAEFFLLFKLALEAGQTGFLVPEISDEWVAMIGNAPHLIPPQGQPQGSERAQLLGRDVWNVGMNRYYRYRSRRARQSSSQHTSRSALGCRHASIYIYTFKPTDRVGIPRAGVVARQRLLTEAALARLIMLILLITLIITLDLAVSLPALAIKPFVIRRRTTGTTKVRIAFLASHAVV